jgi:hypothetical protein
MGLKKNYANDIRGIFAANLQQNWKVKRFTVEVDGNKIDAMIIGLAETLTNSKRWVLNSGGNGEFYEHKFFDRAFQSFLTHMEANAIVFNYPGVGASQGGPDRKTMVKAYQAMLTILEDKANGFGATEIVSLGHSIGGGVQGDALKTHPIKNDIKYVLIKHKTFSSLSAAAAAITKINFVYHLIKFFGWNLDSVESSRKLNVPEIIIQTAKTDEEMILERADQVENDGIIPDNSSLAKELLNAPDLIKHREKKLFIGVPDGHNNILTIRSLEFAKKVIQLLR